MTPIALFCAVFLLEECDVRLVFLQTSCNHIAKLERKSYTEVIPLQLALFPLALTQFAWKYKVILTVISARTGYDISLANSWTHEVKLNEAHSIWNLAFIVSAYFDERKIEFFVVFWNWIHSIHIRNPSPFCIECTSFFIGIKRVKWVSLLSSGITYHVCTKLFICVVSIFVTLRSTWFDKWFIRVCASVFPLFSSINILQRINFSLSGCLCTIFHFPLLPLSFHVLLLLQTNPKNRLHTRLATDTRHHRHCEVYQHEPATVVAHMICTMHRRMHPANNEHNTCLAQWQHAKLFVLAL